MSKQPDLFTQAEESHLRHQNHYLFSDYYLEQLLPADDVWGNERDAAANLLTSLQQLHEKEGANLPNYNEAQLEANWIQPILEQLGWQGAYETQAVIPALTAKKIRKPDYVFFPNSEVRTAAVTRQNTEAYTNDAVAVGEAKRWGVALNKKQGGKPTFENNNPSHQIDYYLRAADVRWGILTDGRYWRLVNKESSYKLDVYFEVDLHDVLVNNSVNGMLYFWLFFRQASFVPDEQGRVFVESALTASVNYAREVENDLRENAYKALEQLIEGFFAFGRNNLSPDNPDHLEAVYTNSLYLLYRLLFLLYGESRGLLSLKNKTYYDVSLTNLINGVEDKLDVDGYPFSPFSQQYWVRQQDLCHIINGTNPAANEYYGVPRYNGGLFSDVNHSFLETHVMGDTYLLRAIDYLARRDRHKKGEKAVKERVDYRTLGVRQLGSIYEGLLEYRPAKAAEPMITIRRKGNEVWIPASERGKKSALERREAGDLYLATDNGERRATGSYYTPDYIVRYIIEQTLQPLLDEIEAAVSDLPDDERGAAYTKRVLALNVLDPAMGSGHFLVAAAEHLALALTNYVTLKSGDLPRANGISELERQAQEKNYWLRRVTESCIYGVDKNEMAVELAKLSLWLTTVAADKPLSFLDHHLRHGDSLVGARLRDLLTLPSTTKNRKKKAQPAEQSTLLDETLLTEEINTAVQRMMGIEQLTSDSVEQIHRKEQMFAELHDAVGRWRTLADVWVSSYFGNGMSPEEYADVARKVQGKATVAADEQLRPFIEHPAVTENDYFHWELQFPEVFFDVDGRALGDNAGFDAIVGNPPYVRQEIFQQVKTFLEDRFETYHGSADLYTYFLEQSIGQLRDAGKLGFIISHKFMRTDSGYALRTFLTRDSVIDQIVHFGDLSVFKDASAYPAILCLTRSGKLEPIQNVFLTMVKALNFDNLGVFVRENGYFVSRKGFQNTGWTLENGSISRLQQKLVKQSVPLSSYIDEQIFYGIKTGFNQAFFLDAQTRSRLLSAHPALNDVIKPLIVGEDLSRYQLAYQNRYLLRIASGWTREISGLSDLDEAWAWLQTQYPQLAEYLEPYRDRAQSRYDQGEFWWELRPCDYYKAFENPKIVYPVIAKNVSFTFDTAGHYTNDKCFIIAKDDKYLLALLNSKLTYFFAKYALSGLKGNYLEFRAVHLQHLPICEVTETTDASIRAMQLVQLQSVWESAENITIPDNIPSDTIHDYLAWLAEQILDLNKRKQKLISRFWIDLEGVTLPKHFAKLQKGKWEETLHKQIPAMDEFVQVASRRSRTLADSLGWNENAFRGFVNLLVGRMRGVSDLLDVYETYHSDYVALTQKIAQTDALIDQLVYKLYGLTDDEIALIEGS